MLDRKHMCINKYAAALCAFLLMVFLACPLKVSASWTDKADESIYSEGKDSGREEKKAEKAGSFEKKVSGLFRNLATGLNDLLMKEGCDLDRIILGRVKSGGQKDSLFTFELRKGNVYGVVAASVYKILRSIMFVVIAGIMLTKLVKGQFTSGNARTREEMKGAVSTTAIGFALLVLMPFLYDMFLYFRDVLLYAVASESVGGMGLVESFYEASSQSGLFIDAMLYLAAVCSCVWFAFEYIGIAMASAVMFICFVFVTVLMFFDKGKLMNWCWNVLSLGVTPLIDISMLMIPVFMGHLAKGQHPLLQLLVTWSVIPSRKLFKNALGLTSTGEAIMSGLSAIAMMHGATSFLRGGAGLAQNTGERLKGSMEDRKKQRYHEDMARAQGEEDGNLRYTSEKHANLSGIKNPFGMYRQKKGMMDNGIGSGAEQPILQNAPPGLGLSKEKEILETENNEHLGNIAAIQQHTAALESEIVQLECADSGDGKEESKKKIDARRMQVAKNQEAAAKENAAIARNKIRIGRIESYMESGAEAGKTASRKELEIMQKHASVDNFEQPEFADLDHATKAKLYGKRAKKRLFQGIGMGFAGTAGLAGGTLLGVSATGFYSRSAAAMVAGALGGGGAVFGGMLGDMAGSSLSRISGGKAWKNTVPRQAYQGTPDILEPDTVSVLKEGMAGISADSARKKQIADIQEVREVPLPYGEAGAGMEKHRTVRQQAQEIASNPKARSVVQEFCREMATPGSKVMQHYEQSARARFSRGSGVSGDMGQAFQVKICREMANQMSGDIMERIAAGGVHIPSNAAYGSVRSAIEANIGGVLKQWSDMSEFRGG